MLEERIPSRIKNFRGWYMQIFKVEIQESLARLVDVEAADEKEAVEIAMNAYQNRDLELDSEDFVDVDFVIVNEE